MSTSSTESSSFGTLLKAFRHRQHITQVGLAEHLGVHRHAIGRWEQERTPREQNSRPRIGSAPAPG